MHQTVRTAEATSYGHPIAFPAPRGHDPGAGRDSGCPSRKSSSTPSRTRRVIVAYSGGTDSAYLAWAAKQALGDNAIAVTADSASIPASHKQDAEAFVRQFDIRHEYVETHEFDNPDYIRNDPNRCFHCKDELFTVLEKIAAERGCDKHRLRVIRMISVIIVPGRKLPNFTR